MDQFLSQPSISIKLDFPDYCKHMLDSISLSSMGLSDYQLNFLLKIIEAGDTREFHLFKLTKLTPSAMKNLETGGFAWSFLLWMTFKNLVEVHLENCGPEIYSEGEYIDSPITRSVPEEIPVSEMNLSVRSKNVLQREGFRSSFDLSNLTRDDLLDLHNLGIGSVNEIEEELKILGIWGSSRSQNSGEEVKIWYPSSTDIPISSLDITTRTMNCLLRGGYNYLSELLAAENNDLRDIRNLGHKSFEEILEIKKTHTSMIAMVPKGDVVLNEWNLSAVLEKIHAAILDDISQFRSKISQYLYIEINQVSLADIEHSIRNRLDSYLRDGSLTVSQVLDCFESEVNSEAFSKKVDSYVIFIAKLEEYILKYVDLRLELLPAKEKLANIDKYENLYSDDSVDILEFDAATNWLLNLRDRDVRGLLGENTFFPFVDKLTNILIISPQAWRALKDILHFYDLYGTFPNLIGLVVASFGDKQINNQGAYEIFEMYLGNAFPVSAERDLSIIQLRMEGNTLDAIGKVHSLTRERVRQILHKYSNHLSSLVEFMHEAAEEEQLLEVSENLVELFRQYGAVYKDELSKVLGLSYEESIRITPKKYQKLIIDKIDEQPSAAIWNKENIKIVLQKAGTYYFPLKSSDYEHLVEIGEIKGPSTGTVIVVFGTWTEACRQAGVEHAQAARSEYVKLWTDEELLSFVVRYIKDESTTGSVNGYRPWRERQIDHVPSEGLIRNQYDSWSNARRKALEIIRRDHGMAVRN